MQTAPNGPAEHAAPPRGRSRRALGVLLAVAALVVPAVVVAQSSGEVSRDAEGHVLHRRPPAPDGGKGEAARDTPVFLYDPDKTNGLPSEMQRDGRAIARPEASLEPSPEEQIHTASGPRRDPNTPAAPTPLEPGTATDPSGPLPPSVDPSLPPVEDPSAPPAPADPDASGGDAASNADATPAEANADAGPTTDVGRESPDGEAAPEQPDEGADPRADLGDEARPDRRTEREGRLDYTEVFDPSIVPFKRSRALDEIAPDFTVRLSERRYKRLEPAGNQLERGREVFWGSLLLEGRGGERIPIPSVSPESRILSYEASPAQRVEFWVDQAGNFYAEPERDGRLRLVFVTDAPGHWFGRTLPRDASFGDIPANLRPRLPRPVQAEAMAVADALGFSATLGFTPLLEKMVAYFRSFAPGEPPPSSGNVYRDVALSRRGICRHRSHAFVVTAQALGYAARYVFNEAHVFVEVFIPGDRAGWLRIDLGGGADELRVHNAENKSLHEPAHDPFAQPEGFGDMAGALRATGLPTLEPGGTGPSTEPAAGSLPTVIPRATPMPGLAPTRTTVAVDEQLVVRGDGVGVRGEVRGVDGRAVDGGVVQVLLVDPNSGEAVALLGSAPVRGGSYEAAIRVPVAQAAGDYELVVEFLGHDGFAASVGR